MSASDYLEKKILDHVFGAVTYSPPETLYFGLATAAISDSDTGSTVTEPAGGAYARVGIANNDTNFPAATGETATKAAAVDVTFVTATAAWGTVTHYFIADAASGGNILVHEALTTAKAIATSDTPRFVAGDLIITGS
jgi:hypothetical protein